MALREAREVVLLVHLEHIRFDDRVVQAPGELHAVVGEEVRIELHVLAHLAAVRALEPGLEQAERSVRIQMAGRARIVVSERQVYRFITKRKGEADEPGAHRILARPQAGEADERHGRDLERELLELVLGQDRAVAPLLDRRWRWWGGGCFSGRRAFHLFQPRLEAIALVLRALQSRIRPEFGELLEAKKKRHIAPHGEELAHLRQPVLKLAQVLAARAFYLVDTVQQVSARAGLLQAREA